MTEIKVATAPSKLSRAQKIMDEQNKQYVKRGITTPDRPIIGTIDTMSKLRGDPIPTGDIIMDYCLAGGYMRGTSSLTYGKEGVGKSFRAMSMAAALLKSKEDAIVLYVQAEPGNPREMAAICGISPDDPRLIIQDVYGSGERAFETIQSFLMEPFQVSKGVTGFRPTDIIDLVIIDSIGQLSPREELEAIAEKGLAESSQGMSLPERMCSRLWRIMASTKMYDRAHLHIVSQVRSDIASYGAPDKPQGGNSTRHASRVTTKLQNIGKDGAIMKGDRQVGHTYRNTFVKEQIRHRWKDYSWESTVIYGQGIDNRGALFTLLTKEVETAFTTAGAWFYATDALKIYLPEGDWRFQGKDRLKDELRTNDVFHDSCLRFVMDQSVAGRATDPVLLEENDSVLELPEGETGLDIDLDVEINMALQGLEISE